LVADEVAAVIPVGCTAPKGKKKGKGYTSNRKEDKKFGGPRKDTTTKQVNK
jgi:hypothetical protein